MFADRDPTVFCAVAAPRQNEPDYSDGRPGEIRLKQHPNRIALAIPQCALAHVSTMLDFARLRGGPDGHRGAFEDLVRQLGRLNPPRRAAMFRHIDGAGGDGGIEAYWICADGSEHGYQAKFHTRSGDIDWRALDKSVTTALATHPRLASLQIAIACDLTDVVRGRRGRSGWARWEAHRTRWQALASSTGRRIDFLLWGASEIEQLLADPAATGLRDYWFDDTVLSPAWFEAQFELTQTMLDERYHPEDHVDVEVRSAFDGLRRTQKWRHRLNRLYALYCELSRSVARRADLSPSPEVIAEIEGLSQRESDFALDVDVPFPTKTWKFALDRIHDSARGVIEGQHSFNQAALVEGFDHFRLSWERLRDAVGELAAALDETAHAIDGRRCVLLLGRAGSGKSHLLASETAAALQAGEPAVLVLGTDFAGNETPGAQIVRRLGLPSSVNFDSFLTMFSAAAEIRNARAVLVVDAINEGAGARLWREQLAPFIRTVLRHPRVALCISCRTEFAEYLIGDTLKRDIPCVTVPGFVTPQEQEHAARIYLDGRGIVRPATPWLSPEFTNPLFLRTACQALEAQGRREFPRGLRGTREMMRFYLDAAGKHLGTAYDGARDLIPPLRRTVLRLAGLMTDERNDYVTRDAASRIVETEFASFMVPEGFGWLDVLRMRGVLRTDPAPTDPADPLDPDEGVLRFGFQRFQEHLIAQSLIEQENGPAGLFDAEGPLSFLLDGDGVRFSWRGVFAALTIQFADVWRVELVDYLPGGVPQWWDVHAVQDAFVESVRWRLISSFTERSLDLLRQLKTESLDYQLLLELAVVQDHPWNADFLHDRLCRLPMRERDTLWSHFLDRSLDDTGSLAHPANRVIDWGATASSVAPSSARLGLLTLGWMCSASSWAIRDRATSAATEILLLGDDQGGAFIRAFARVDDLSVVERVLAACAGACLRDPTPARLRDCADAVWGCVFESRSPPLHTVIRDYAALIIELAHERGVLDADIELERCRPPYRSDPPTFGLSRASIETLIGVTHAKAIFESELESPGLGHKSIAEWVRGFSAIRLNAARPLRTAELYQAFRTIHVDPFPAAASRFDAIENLIKHPASLREGGNAGSTAAIEEAAASLSSLGLMAFVSDALPHIEGAYGWAGFARLADMPRIDQEQAKLWIIRRAIELDNGDPPQGDDESDGDAGDGEGQGVDKSVVWLGPKEQQRAFHELLARLADNFWLADEAGEAAAKMFETPLDLPLLRDIDPTAPLHVSPRIPVSDPSFPRLAPLSIRHVPTDRLEAWTFDDAAAANWLRLGLGEDVEPNGEWVMLFRVASASLDYNTPAQPSQFVLRQSDSGSLRMVAVEAGARAAFVQRAKRDQVTFDEWFRHEDPEGPYLYEAGLRPTWPQHLWSHSHGPPADGLRFIPLTHSYRRSRGLYGDLPNGFRLEIPAPWLLKALRLTADPQRYGVYRDRAKIPVILSCTLEGDSYCVARRDRIMPLLEQRGLAPVWGATGERSSWGTVGRNAASRHSWSGLLWLTRGGPRRAVWRHDRDPFDRSR